MNLRAVFIYFLFFKIFYLFIHERHREAETEAEGEAGSLRGACCGTRSQDPGITTQAKGRRSTAEPPRRPSSWVFSPSSSHPLLPANPEACNCHQLLLPERGTLSQRAKPSTPSYCSGACEQPRSVSGDTLSCYVTRQRATSGRPFPAVHW